MREIAAASSIVVTVQAVIRKLCPLLLGAAVVTSVVACGGGDAGTPRSGYPTIKFVGNPTCPTDNATPYSPSPPNVNSLPPVGQAIDEMPHTHVVPPAQVTYNHDPPTSGCHYNLGYGNAPIQAGAYNKVVQAQFWVHNLEHGYVVVLYNCPQGCDAQFQQLRQWYHSLRPDPTTGYAKVLVLPWPTMDVPFAAVSWDWYDPIPTFSIAEVQKFYANHVGQAVEPNSDRRSVSAEPQRGQATGSAPNRAPRPAAAGGAMP